MKTKYILVASLALTTLPSLAQETYQNTKLVESDLNGTARYVGMGGAMEALGADISTIKSNPAGIGLFRSSQISLSAGLLYQADADTKMSFDGVDASINGKTTNLSFDQLGVVWSNKWNDSYINLAFNYNKSRNFDQILTAVGNLNGTSLSKLSALKHQYLQEFPDDESYIWNGVDDNFGRAIGMASDGSMNYYNGRSYLFGQYQKGYIGEYDFNLSGNYNDRFFWGLTAGFHDVNYRSNSYYTENYDTGKAYSDVWEDLRIDGLGLDLKIGAIWRPVESSPFRIGLYINTPVYYDLSMRGAADLTVTDEEVSGDNKSTDQGNSCSYDYAVSTPWKFGLSLGHTIGKQFAFGATYEYADYSSINNKVKVGNGDYENTYEDDEMNADTDSKLKGVSTFKLGFEYKPLSNIAFRVGYNYVSPLFKETAYRDGTRASYGSRYSTSADYTNWKATNRITCGFGYSSKKWFADLAYQYSTTDGEFYPFGNEYLASGYDVKVTPRAVDVSNHRHQLLMTLGYKF